MVLRLSVNGDCNFMENERNTNKHKSYDGSLSAQTVHDITSFFRSIINVLYITDYKKWNHSHKTWSWILSLRILGLRHSTRSFADKGTSPPRAYGFKALFYLSTHRWNMLPIWGILKHSTQRRVLVECG